MSVVDVVIQPVLRRALGMVGRSRLPLVSGELRLAALDGPVDVVRDRWGVPHIYAHSRHDLMFAQGFVHAQDRLWQMDFQRRLVSGRLAEVLGEPAVQIDRWMRVLSMRRVAEQEVALLTPQARSSLEAYASGVSACIGLGRLPVEFMLLHYTPEPWRVADTLCWIKMMSWSLSVNWETEMLRAQLIERLGPQAAAELERPYFDHWPSILAGPPAGALARADAARPFLGPPPTAGLGSNNWVIAGSRTATGKPLLANDMHLMLGLPSTWYENHLSDGEWNTTGITFPGIPGVVAGHNDYVAWGFTNGFPDVQDLYIERLRRDEGGKMQYEYQGKWMDATVIREEIRVKGGAPVVEEVVVTRHGPIINTLAAELEHEEPLALCWTSLEPDTMIHALFGLNDARNCLEVREALRAWTAPVQNVVYADVEGNIAYSFPGKVPIRANGDGQVPVPGWTGEHEWVGYIPYDELPHLYNPPQGYIVSANNRVAPDDYPYDLGQETCRGDRAQRIAEMIEACPGQIDVSYVRRMQFDQVSPTARVVAQFLGALPPDSPQMAAVSKLMGTWDGTLGPDSPTAAVHEVFVRRVLVALLSDNLQDLTLRYMGKGPTPILAEASMFGERSLEWLQWVLADPDATWFARPGDHDPAAARRRREQIARQALHETLAFLASELGPEIERWGWGRLHTLTFTHVLGRSSPLDTFFNRGPYPVGGDGTTVWAAGSSYHNLDSQVIVGPPFRFIADLGDLDGALGLICPGQSGQPGSPHYDDQVADWFAGRYHPMLFRRAEVERAAEAVLRLSPGLSPP